MHDRSRAHRVHPQPPRLSRLPILDSDRWSERFQFTRLARPKRTSPALPPFSIFAGMNACFTAMVASASLSHGPVCYLNTGYAKSRNRLRYVVIGGRGENRAVALRSGCGRVRNSKAPCFHQYFVDAVLRKLVLTREESSVDNYY